jgi:serine/threonine protein kinase
MEHCKNMDLKTHLQNHGVLSERDARTIASQVLEGVSLMHENGIAHRDLKPAVSTPQANVQILNTYRASQNILIQSKPPEDEAWWVVLADLGLSRRPGDGSGTTTVRGTPGFMAPETIGHPFHGHPKNADPFGADMWCLGETISYALTGRGTFRDNEDLLQYQANPVTFPDERLREKGLSDDAIQFIRSLLNVQPAQRPTATQALKGSWITRMSSVTPDTTVVGSQTSSADPAVASISAHSIITQMRQDSGSIFSADTQASAVWTTTIANAGLPRSIPGSGDQQNVSEPIETLNTQYPGFTSNPGHSQYYPRAFGLPPQSSYGHFQQSGYSRYGQQPGYGGYAQQPGYALPEPSGYARYPVLAPPSVQHPAFVPTYPVPYRNFDPHAALDNSPYTRMVPIPSFNPTEHPSGMRHEFAPTPLDEVEAGLTEKRGDRSHQTGVDRDTKDPPKQLSILGKPGLIEKQREKIEEQKKKAQDSKAAELEEFKKFCENFHLRTPVPVGILPILAMSEEKQDKIVDTAIQHAGEKRKIGTLKGTQNTTNPTPPTSATLSSHDCTQFAFQTLNSLNMPPERQISAGEFNGTQSGLPTLDSVLSTNKAAVEKLYILLGCSCSSNPHFSTTIACTLCKILSWYKAIAGANQKSESSPHETQIEAFTYTPVSLGAFRPEHEDTFRTNVILSELIRIEKLIDKFSERYCKSANPAETGIEGGVYSALEALLRTRVRDTFKIIMRSAPENIKRQVADRSSQNRLRVNTS